jgi:rhodanese-related sulfurtransferase
MTQPKPLGPAFAALAEAAKNRIQRIHIGDYMRLAASGEPFLLIDAREDNEWATGHASGAIHLSKGIIERDIEEKVPDKATKLVIYCSGGLRSALAADALRNMGYTKAISLDGGFKVWKDADLPIEQ